MQGYLLHRDLQRDLHHDHGPAGLERCELPDPVVGPNDVLVRVHAVSLNARDLAVAAAPTSAPPRVPCSDGAGEVVAVGPAVVGLKPGARVMSHFFPHWADGAPTPERTAVALGGNGPGVLAQYVALPEQAWLALPPSLGWHEAATVPCAGVTAWNALFGVDPLRPGDTVLTLGTGGVSLWALQLGCAAGLRMLVTSSSPAKLERARRLGAAATIDYRATPDWAPAVLELTGGEGVARVIETAGRETLPHSMACVRHGGTVAVVGGTSGWGGEIDADAMIDRALRLQGVLVGPRSTADALLRFVDAAGIRPVIDRCFPFAQAREAYAHLAARNHFGKVVIDLDAP
jgi:NADPH:quinone reductase-like Zn-dependent oxidoreductase